MNINENIRPDPDDLLNKIKKEEAQSKKGKLKIFLGMCAGVGKTYEMLKAAHKIKKDGADVVIGYVEPHDRPETMSLIEGIESIPRQKINYKGIITEEPDLDGILARKPEVVLLDELAHTNNPASRHLKRYQDVLEILNNGISVYTTVNVQHFESRTDTVEQITGISVIEKIPDSILELADEVELIDISPEDLLKRLDEGKVYAHDFSANAIKNFFRKGNLTALREMSLRITAERVEQQLHDYMEDKKIDGPWKSGQRLMVAIGPSPYSAELIRWARRLAYTMEANWIAVYIETSKDLSPQEKERLNRNIILAKELGAQFIRTLGEDIVSTLLAMARQNNITQIVIGKTRNSFSLLKPDDITKRLIKESGNIDVYVVGGDNKRTDSTPDKKIFFNKITIKMESRPLHYLIATTILAVVIFICHLLLPFIGYTTVAMILLLLICILPLFTKLGPVLLVATLSSLIWNYLFIPPKFTFYIHKPEDLLMFMMYFIIAIVSGVLTSRIKSQEEIARQREEKITILYNLTHDLSVAKTLDEVIDASIKNIKNFLPADIVFLLALSENVLSDKSHKCSTFIVDDKEYGVASWVFNNQQKAGKGTNTLPASQGQYFPVFSQRFKIGVIGIKLQENQTFSNEQEILLENFISQITSALERELLNEAHKKAMILDESEKLYKTLFNSISHELKTPLTTIMSASSYLLDKKIANSPEMMSNLGNEIYIASTRLNRLVKNLLDMSRIEYGKVKLNLKWNDINDILTSVLNDLKEELSNHNVKLEFTDGLEPLNIDFGLLEHAIGNIILNSATYTPPGTNIVIKTHQKENKCIISIYNNGPALPFDSLDKIFDKFYRIPGTKTGGTGLGLSIAKGFIEAHKGKIKVENVESGGVKFIIILPVNLEK